MKKIILLLVILIATIIYSDNLAVKINSGIPIGQWANELNRGYSLDINYYKTTSYIEFFSGINLLSFSTSNYEYTVFLFKIPIGFDFALLKTPSYRLGVCTAIGISFLNRQFGADSEWGFNEFVFSELNFNFITLNNFTPFIYVGYERQKIISGGNYAYFGIGCNLNIFSMFSGL